MGENVVRFLDNPLRVGAYCARLTIPHSAIVDLFNYTSNIAKTKRKRLKVDKPDDDRDYYHFMSKSGYPSFANETIDGLLSFLNKHDNTLAQEVKDWSDYGEMVIAPIYFTENEPEYNADDYYFFFGQQAYFKDISDAISIMIDDKAGPDMVAEVICLTPKAMLKFKEFVLAVPCFKNKTIFKDEGLQHTKASIYNLYPAVLSLWLETAAHVDVKRDSIDYLSQALNYLDKKEWRMVIILCSLMTEGVLADIYENVLIEEAPENPLGSLIKDINDRRKFPPEIYKKLDSLNTVRNNALHHKGITTPNRQEALLGLINATKFSLWWSFSCKDWCKPGSDCDS